MINKLKDISVNTPIAGLPAIFNANNLAIADEIDYYFDVSTGRLTKSVYAPTGSVKAHYGDFQNLNVGNLTIDNPNTLMQIINNNIDVMSHNNFVDIYSDSVLIPKFIGSDVSNICHDASAIIMPISKANTVYSDYVDTDVTPTVYNVLDKCIQKINSLEQDMLDTKPYLANIANNIYTPTNGLTTTNTNTGTTTDSTVQTAVITEVTIYPISYVGENIVQLRKKGIPSTHANDLAAGRQFTYYPAANNVEITNKNINFIETYIPGTIVNIVFNKVNSGQFKILLSRQSLKEVVMSNNSLNRLQLYCVSYSDTYGPEWDLYSYSIQNKTDITLTTLS